MKERFLFLVILIMIGGLLIMNEHEKVYAVCENLCMEETMTKEQIEEKISENDSKYILKDDFAVINTQVTTDSNGSGSITIDFPDGFTKNNCIVLSAVYKNSASNAYPKYYGFGRGYNAQIQTNPMVTLGDFSTYDNTKIVVSMETATASVITYDIQIVLMKVA